MGTGFHGFAIHRLADDRAVRRFDGDGFDGFAGLVLDVARHTCDRAAGAHARHEHIDGSIAIVPDFRAGCLEMDVRVGGIVELPGHEIFGGVAVGDFLGFGDRTRHAFGCFCEHKFCTKHRHDATTLDRHRFGHREDQLVAP